MKDILHYFCLSFLALFVSGCSHTHPVTGETTSQDFIKACNWVALKNVQSVNMPDGSQIHSCVNGEMYRFKNEVFVEKVSPLEAIAEYEDGVCKSYGLAPGNEQYVDCRMNLAKIRTHNQMANQYQSAQNQAQAAQMMMLGLGILIENQPTYAPTPSNNMQTPVHCRAQQMGHVIHYSCF